VWRRPAVVSIDDDNLTPILDAVKRRGWPRGWQREFDYVEFRGEHWEVPDIRYLFNRIFKRLWADSRQSVIDFSARRGGPVYPAKAWNGQWDELATAATSTWAGTRSTCSPRSRACSTRRVGLGGVRQVLLHR
jgi:hypothetical protein